MLRRNKLCVSTIILVISFIFIFDASTSFAQGALEGSMKKFCRGLLNTVFGAVEILETPLEIGREQGVVVGGTYGALKGFLNFGKRTLIGVYELVTFPIPIPANYEPILKEPEYYPSSEGEGVK